MEDRETERGEGDGERERKATSEERGEGESERESKSHSYHPWNPVLKVTSHDTYKPTYLVLISAKTE